MVQPHVLLVTFPAQGHINPSLQFAKRLIKLGIEVTFATSVFAHRRIVKTTASTAPEGLKFAAYSDGYDDGFKPDMDDSRHYMLEIRIRGSQTLRDIIIKSSDEGRPVTFLVYTLLLPWAAEVARELHIPYALLWIQSATVLDIYYYYFNGYEDEMKSCSSNDPSWSIQLPRLPLLKSQELPSFIVSSSSKDDKYRFVLPSFKEQLDTLDGEENPKVLVNTFDALELEPLKAIEKYNLIGVGPLIPSSFLDGKDPLDSSICGDLFQKSNDYLEWMNSNPESSIVYISFGSLLNLSRNQKEEIAKGLIETKRPFLWVIRDQDNMKEVEKEEEKLSCMMDLEKQGKIVPWCSQLEVLTHPSLGCFVSHCGWNSTLESLSSGVPMVAYPHLTDQGTNAKMIEDVWKIGVRLRVNEDGVVECEEIKRCIEIVMDGGEKGEELRKNAQKRKELAREAVKEGGSSEINLKVFVQEVGKCC